MSTQLLDRKPPFSGVNFHPFDVVEAARRRIRYLMNRFDDLVVSFSGGKDSLVVMELVKQEYERAGRTDLPRAKFMDEELVCDSIIDFVKEVHESGRFELRWLALPMYVGFFVMGQHKKFLAWDKARKWHRQPPSYAILDVGVDTSQCNENTIGRVLYPDSSRSSCVLLGIRAQESMKRLQSISKGGRAGGEPNWLGLEEGCKHVWVGKPIFDWTEFDVFKFFHDYQVRYCTVYDAQLWAKAPLRVASAMHERAESQFFKLKELEPLFYEQLREFYPEIETHYRYWKSVDRFALIKNYPPTFDGIRRYITEHLDESHQPIALEFVKGAESRRRATLERDPTVPLGHQPVLQIFRLVVAGRFLKGTNMRLNVTPEDIAYESGR